MKRLLLVGLLFCGGAFAEYTAEEKASLESQYQRAIKSYKDDKDAAAAIRTLAQFFSSDEKVIGAIVARYQQGDITQFRKLSSYRYKLSDYGAKIGSGSFYGYCKDTSLNAQLLWINYDKIATNNNQETVKRASQRRTNFYKAYIKCKEELMAPEPKREDFKPLAII